MKYIMLVHVCLFFATVTLAQQKEIDEQVWRPFIQAFNKHDTPAFMAVHSKDLARIPYDSKTISTFATYQKQNEEGNKRAVQEGIQHTIELRFIQRMANDTQACDVGIYKTTIIRATGESQSFYGKFFVVLRKENNRWKILVDSDSSEGGISEKDFEAASPMK